ncbi:ABC transporter substrate-binding protein [Candidatus Woesearchaeota archaeon]|nr:ABC transporter substrate-binding protein [Candidatus Woesearchaeota archaeon]
MNWTWRGIIAVLVVLIIVLTIKPSLFEPASVAQKLEGQIYIGGLLPLSNIPQDKEILLTELRNSAVLAVEDINYNGGIDNHQLILVYGDTECNSGKAVNAALDMIDNYETSAFVAAQCGDELDALAKVTDEKRKLLFSVTDFDPNAQMLEHDLFFKNSMVNNETMSKFREILTTQFNLTKIAFLFEDKEYPVRFKEDIKKELEDSVFIVAEEGFKTTDTDFRAPLAKIKSSKPEAIILLGQTPETMYILLQQIKQQGMNQMIITNNVVSELIDMEGAELDNVFYIDAAREVSEDFLKKYEARFGKELKNKFLASCMYDSLHLLKDSIEETIEFPYDMSEYLKQLEDHEGTSGKMSIRRNGNIVHEICLNQIKNNEVYLVE